MQGDFRCRSKRFAGAWNEAFLRLGYQKSLHKREQFGVIPRFLILSTSWRVLVSTGQPNMVQRHLIFFLKKTFFLTLGMGINHDFKAPPPKKKNTSVLLLC